MSVIWTAANNVGLTYVPTDASYLDRIWVPLPPIALLRARLDQLILILIAYGSNYEPLP